MEITDRMTLLEKRELINILIEDLNPKQGQPGIDQIPDNIQKQDPSRPDFQKKFS